MDLKEFAAQLETLAVLEEPLRRKLYLYVAGREEPVGRDEAARAAGVSRALAAFHLDKLVGAGLLEATFRRLSGRKGPGAGRPSKLYRRSSADFGVNLPPRRYELAAHVFARVLNKMGDAERRDLLHGAARDSGLRLAQEAAVVSRRGQPLSRAAHALTVCGYEPALAPDGELLLRNCPFDSLRKDCTQLTCGMNLALIEGLVTGLGLQEVQVRLAPREGHCCVALRAKREAA